MVLAPDPGSAANEALAVATAPTDWWTVHRGFSPVLGTAIHNGHEMGGVLTGLTALSEAERLREEDPFTEFLIRDLPNRIVFHRSRFEVDLNRPRAGAVYRAPEEAWGLDVWRQRPADEAVAPSLRLHDAYYAMLRQVVADMQTWHGQLVVLDIHSYNHRRDGPGAPATDPEAAPEINIGTFSMDRERWAHVLDPFIARLRQFRFRGRPLDVRENVAFEGRGAQTRFIHETFPKTACAIAVEFKKIFMDEWTGQPDRAALNAFRAMIAATVPVLEAGLRAGR